MARRFSWKTHLRISLVMVPVKGYTASATAQGRIHLHQLHAKCKSRIRYAKTCPIHGEVTKEEIVSGYEYSRGKYAILTPDDIDALRTERDKAISIEAVIRPDQLDPIYYTDRNYFLAPDGSAAHKVFAVLQRALDDTGNYAIAHAVIMRQDHVVLLRPAGGLFVLTVLNYQSQVKDQTEFRDEVPKSHFSDKDLELAKELLEGSKEKKFDFATYRDQYTEKLKELIDAKIKGKEVAVEREHDGPRIINLMDALRKSVAKTSQHTVVHHRSARRSHGKKRKTG